MTELGVKLLYVNEIVTVHVFVFDVYTFGKWCPSISAPKPLTTLSVVTVTHNRMVRIIMAESKFGRFQAEDEERGRPAIL